MKTTTYLFFMLMIGALFLAMGAAATVCLGIYIYHGIKTAWQRVERRIRNLT